MHRCFGEAAREPEGEPGTRAAGQAASERPKRPAEERQERPGLSVAEIEAGTRGAASVTSDGTVRLRLLAPFSVKVGFGLKGQRATAFDHLTFRPLPASFRASGGDRLLSVFATSIDQPPKVAKRIVKALSKRDFIHVQALVGHVMMVRQDNADSVDRAETLALLTCED